MKTRKMINTLLVAAGTLALSMAVSQGAWSQDTAPAGDQPAAAAPAGDTAAAPAADGKAMHHKGKGHHKMKKADDTAKPEHHKGKAHHKMKKPADDAAAAPAGDAGTTPPAAPAGGAAGGN